MSNERTLVDDVRQAIFRDDRAAVVLKPNDNFTVGIPDLLVYASTGAAALELKVTKTLPRDPDSPTWLDHPLSATQCALLKRLAAVDVTAFAIIRVIRTAELWALRGASCVPELSYNHLVRHGEQISLAPGLLNRLHHIHRSPPR